MDVGGEGCGMWMWAVVGDTWRFSDVGNSG